MFIIAPRTNAVGWSIRKSPSHHHHHHHHSTKLMTMYEHVANAQNQLHSQRKSYSFQSITNDSYSIIIMNSGQCPLDIVHVNYTQTHRIYLFKHQKSLAFRFHACKFIKTKFNTKRICIAQTKYICHSDAKKKHNNL